MKIKLFENFDGGWILENIQDIWNELEDSDSVSNFEIDDSTSTIDSLLIRITFNIEERTPQLDNKILELINFTLKIVPNLKFSWLMIDGIGDKYWAKSEIFLLSNYRLLNPNIRKEVHYQILLKKVDPNGED